jgi:transcriptional regulator with XRE-family HTH domain
MSKFADWMESNDKKQRAVAQKLKISTSTLHDVLKKGQMPSLKLAYEIEKYTQGAVTVYDWLDENKLIDKKKSAKMKINEKSSV